MARSEGFRWRSIRGASAEKKRDWGKRAQEIMAAKPPEERQAIAERRKAGVQRYWTPERRAEASTKARERWEAIPEETRTQRLNAAREAYFRNNPRRRVMWDWWESAVVSGDVVVETCECGNPKRPFWDWTQEGNEYQGQRCWPCWKKAQS